MSSTIFFFFFLVENFKNFTNNIISVEAATVLWYVNLALVLNFKNGVTKYLCDFLSYAIIQKKRGNTWVNDLHFGLF
jgi:hypothetical protein